MRLTMRRAEHQDLDALVAFDHVAQVEDGRVELLRRSIQTGHCFVAEGDGEIVGYAVLDYGFFDNGMLELVYVAESHRRSGVGRALVEHAERVCETPKLFTSTNLSNKPMQSLLEGVGYALSGYVDNLDEGDPELIYFKRLWGEADTEPG